MAAMVLSKPGWSSAYMTHSWMRCWRSRPAHTQNILLTPNSVFALWSNVLRQRRVQLDNFAVTYLNLDCADAIIIDHGTDFYMSVP